MEIIGMCNPLLDLTVEVDKMFLDEYALDENNAIIAEEKHLPIYPRIAADPAVIYGAGGSGQNTMRVAQWILDRKDATAFFGAVGCDDNADRLAKEAEGVGLHVHYAKIENVPTGTCAVLINGHHRSMVANLGAANSFNVSHLEKEKNWRIVEAAKMFYITGFFYTVSVESILKIGEHCAATGKRFCMNLSAPFLFTVPIFFESFKKTLPLVDVYFGNEVEFAALSQAFGWGDVEKNEVSYEDITKKLATLPGKKNQKMSRIVVLTRGSNPSIFVEGTEYGGVTLCETVPVIPATAEEIVDTNGCGDAFAGGVMAGLVRGKSILESAKIGNYCANVVLKNIGCTYPTTPNSPVRL